MEDSDPRYLDYLSSDFCKDGGSFEEYLETAQTDTYEYDDIDW